MIRYKIVYSCDKINLISDTNKLIRIHFLNKKIDEMPKSYN